MGVAVAILGLSSPQGAVGQEPTSVEIGMPESLFQGIPRVFREAGAKPFLKLMKDSTGIEGHINFEADAMTLAAKINDGKIQLGVFQGHEFAWAKAKYKDLTPIAVADPMRPVQAFCVVHWNCNAKNIDALKGGMIALPPIHRDYCAMFLAREMKNEKFKGQLIAATASDAIFDVIEEKCACTVVDCATLKFFQNNNPGSFKMIKVLCESNIFPNACIAVKKGQMPEATVAKFKKALLSSKDLPGGRPMLAAWKLNGFVNVPDSYEAELNEVLKVYPKPHVPVNK